ncbi:MAG: hypothetical protein QF475_01620 [Candidatus Undinarchaeales archaeon]|jgi:hypothetical protein|nr:hypothetical protein [Candidatus Undinarchaeales archaeon]
MKLKKIFLAIGIGVLAALFVGFLIEAIYESPEHDDYCKYGRFESVKPMTANTDLCDFTYDPVMQKECIEAGGAIRYEYDENGCVSEEICDYCQKDFRSVFEKYNKNLFFITAPIGLLLIILGLYLPTRLDAMAGGSLLAGILTMIQITMRVFGDLGKWTRVILLGLELVIVVWIGMKKVQDTVKK